jgi:hypothetical protein
MDFLANSATERDPALLIPKDEIAPVVPKLNVKYGKLDELNYSQKFHA